MPRIQKTLEDLINYLHKLMRKKAESTKDQFKQVTDSLSKAPTSLKDYAELIESLQ